MEVFQNEVKMKQGGSVGLLIDYQLATKEVFKTSNVASENHHWNHSSELKARTTEACDTDYMKRRIEKLIQTSAPHAATLNKVGYNEKNILNDWDIVL